MEKLKKLKKNKQHQQRFFKLSISSDGTGHWVDNDLWMFHLGNLSWTRKQYEAYESVPDVRCSHAIAHYDNYMVLYGGRGPPPDGCGIYEKRFSDVWRLDLGKIIMFC